MRKYKNIDQIRIIWYNTYRWMVYISSSCEKKLCNHSTTAPLTNLFEFFEHWYIESIERLFFLLLQRNHPKEALIENISDTQLNQIASWMNNYTRKILNYKTSLEDLLEEINNKSIIYKFYKIHDTVISI